LIPNLGGAEVEKSTVGRVKASGLLARNDLANLQILALPSDVHDHFKREAIEHLGGLKRHWKGKNGENNECTQLHYLFLSPSSQGPILV